MKYYSSNKLSPPVSLSDALLQGLAPDGGLYMPEHIPVLSKAEIESLSEMSVGDIAYKILWPYLNELFSERETRQICAETFNFPAPLVRLKESVFALELFHGPTLAFKDFGARFLARCLSRLTSSELTVLVATSGDTGSAVAQGFLGVPGVQVVILYPSAKVSSLQEKQLTTAGENVKALEVLGTFDDCQALVKQAFADTKLRQELQLTSANSINIGRLLPQMFYYFFAYSQIPSELRSKNLVVSVPSGNLGNLSAGLMAKRMGLPISRFIAGLNKNNVLEEFLNTGKFAPRASIPSVSNAMDVGNPSNLQRLIELYKSGQSSDAVVELLSQHLAAHSFSDEAVLSQIKEVYSKQNYLLDPHGAIGMLALELELRKGCELKRKEAVGELGIFLHTAHPAKFMEIVQLATQAEVRMPEVLRLCLSKEKRAKKIAPEYAELREELES